MTPALLPRREYEFPPQQGRTAVLAAHLRRVPEAQAAEQAYEGNEVTQEQRAGLVLVRLHGLQFEAVTGQQPLVPVQREGRNVLRAASRTSGSSGPKE